MSDQTRKCMISEIIGIRIYMWEEITFYRHTLQLLENPINLNFWWNEKEKILLIGAANEPTSGTVSVSNCFHNSISGPKICNKNLLRIIQRLAKITDRTSVILTGEFIPELKMVAFKLDKENKEEHYEKT
jgi:hypothetical protein